MDTLISRSPEETLRLGEAWGRAAQRGWVLGLTGELGAGKTQLVKGIALGLGVPARVHSPTFTLVNEYRGGRLPLFHLDLYRLGSAEQIAAAGIEDYLQPDGVSVVEWAERWPEFNAALAVADRTRDAKRETPICPARFRRVAIETLGETERRIRYEDFGA